VDNGQILDIVHQTAAEMMAAKDGEVVEHGSAVSTEGADSSSTGTASPRSMRSNAWSSSRGSSGSPLADEDLNEEMLSSATALAKRIAVLRQTQASASRQ